MAPKFGTSGLRGLVTELTPALVADHVAAFLAACPAGTGLFVARDRRPSSPTLAEVVIDTGRAAGLTVTDCGAVPTPALALAAMGAGAAAVMVTGSHIPADRNGLKFYTPAGEITKAEEATILAALGAGREYVVAPAVGQALPRSHKGHRVDGPERDPRHRGIAAIRGPVDRQAIRLGPAIVGLSPPVGPRPMPGQLPAQGDPVDKVPDDVTGRCVRKGNPSSFGRLIGFVRR